MSSRIGPAVGNKKALHTFGTTAKIFSAARVFFCIAITLVVGAASVLHVSAAASFKALPYTDPFSPAATPSDLTYSQPVSSVIINENLAGIALPITRTMANVSSGLGAITIEWWMKQKPVGQPILNNPNGTIIHGPGFAVNADFRWGDPNLGSLLVNFSQNKGGQYVGNRGAVIPNIVSDEQWHQYVVTYDLRTVRTYRDGELLEQRWLDNNADRLGPYEDDSMSIKTSIIEIGGGVTTSGSRFQNGYLEGIRVSSMVLSPWQVKRNYENARSYTRTIYVAPNGTGTGSQASPMSLASAMAQVGASTRIILQGGTYNGADFQVTRSGTGPREHCLIIGADGATPAIISGGSPALSGAGYITLRNLTFSSDTGVAALQINNAPKAVTVDSCRFSGNQRGLSANSSPFVTVQNCVANSATGLYFYNSTDSIVRQNTIVNGSVGIQYDTGSRRISLLNNLMSGQSSACLQINNDSQKEYRGNGNLYNPSGATAAVIAGQNFTAAQAANRALANAWYTFDTQDVADSRLRRTAHSAEANSMAFAPIFVDAANGDFRLASVAANAVDAGAERTFQHTSIASESIRRGVLPTVSDATGTLRPLGNAIDVGAYETVPLNYAVFFLDADYTCSAGVYKPDGTLIRTLFSGQRRPQGTNVIFWNGLDDNKVIAPNDTYTIKMIAHNVQYVWEGIVGNSSNPNADSHVHGGFEPIYAMAIVGTTAFYTAGYNENKYELYRFDTGDANNVTKSFGPIHNIYSDAAWDLATDGTKLYTLNSAQIAIYNTSTCSATTFGNGQSVVGAGSGIGAIEVQRNGSLLFVSRRDQNLVYIFDKSSGNMTGSFSVAQPGDLAVTASGDLWVLSGGTSAIRYQCNASGGNAVQTVGGFTKAVNLACSPVDGMLIVAEAATHQVKAFSAAGAALWTLGQANGYANGPRVTPDKFFFCYINEGRTYYFSALAFQPDGTFWVGDTFMSRYLHFNTSQQLINEIDYAPHNYTATADLNNPTRVFNRFTEYAVDYSKPLGQGWKITNFWGYGAAAFYGFQDGVWSVVTLSNGRTYGTSYDSSSSWRQVVELTANGLRETGTRGLQGNTRIEKDGSILTYSDSGGTVTFQRKPLTGFDGAGNPIWGAAVNLASASSGHPFMTSDPFDGSAPFNYGYPQISGNMVISYDANRLNSGFHLGAVKQGSSQWLWKAMPSAGGFDGYGTFDSWCEYAGNIAMTSGRNIFAGAHGEFYNDIGQVNQFFHFYDNGLFVGEFGTPMLSGVCINAPGSSGNNSSPVLVDVGTNVYLYHNDEWGRGSIRWKPAGIGGIRELSAQVLQGQAPTGTTNTVGDGGSNTNSTGTNTNGTGSTNSSPLCDLVVTGFSITPSAPTLGASVRFNATIKNQGNDATPAGAVLGIGFYVDGVVQAWWFTSASNLAAGASWNISSNDGPNAGIWLATPGTHTVTAIIDDASRIPEANEANNSLSLSTSLTVGGTNSATGPKIAIRPAGGGKLSLNWPSTSGGVYQVSCKTNLTDTSWSALSAELTAPGASMTYTDAPPAGAAMRLYKVTQVR